MKLLLFLSLIAFSNQLFAQDKLTFREKFIIRKELKQMLKNDQKYREEIAYGNLSKTEVDSLWVLQNREDSLNRIKFKQIIDKYGYPSIDRVGTQISYVLVLHFTRQSDFDYLKESFKQELDNKTMPPIEYAKWYDRSQLINGREVKFGAYGDKKFCGDELGKVNQCRLEIGLEILQNECK